MRLQQVQEEEGLKFANKLGRRHVQFEQHKMKVYVATQILSARVADAHEYLRAAHVPGFDDASETLCFIRIVDRIFDFLNLRSRFSKGYEQPVMKHSLPFGSDVVHMTNTYLGKL